MNNQSKALLSVRNINKAFSGVAVLNDINMDVQAGEVFGILGKRCREVYTFEDYMWHLHTHQRQDYF